MWILTVRTCSRWDWLGLSLPPTEEIPLGETPIAINDSFILEKSCVPPGLYFLFEIVAQTFLLPSHNWLYTTVVIRDLHIFKELSSVAFRQTHKSLQHEVTLSSWKKLPRVLMNSLFMHSLEVYCYGKGHPIRKRTNNFSLMLVNIINDSILALEGIQHSLIHWPEWLIELP